MSTLWLVSRGPAVWTGQGAKASRAPFFWIEAPYTAMPKDRGVLPPPGETYGMEESIEEAETAQRRAKGAGR
jgi:hypothetical protein